MAKSSKLVIDVIDESDIVGWLTSATTWNEIAVVSVNDMVNKVIGRAKANGTNSGHGAIYRLNIYGHAAPGDQSIGSGTGSAPGKTITAANVHKYKPTLSKLKPYFTKDAIVTLHGCEVAEGASGIALLKGLSSILGVPVQGGVKNQRPLLPGMEGSVKRCTPGDVHDARLYLVRNAMSDAPPIWTTVGS